MLDIKSLLLKSHILFFWNVYCRRNDLKMRLYVKNFIIIIFLIFTTFLCSEELFFDDFEGGFGNWNVINNGGQGLWTIYAPPYPNSYTLPPPSSGNVCAADSDETGSGTTTNTTLELSNPLDLSTYDTIVLEFDSDFNAIDVDDLCFVDVSVDGSTWTNVLTYNGIDVRDTHEIIDISTIANMQSSVYIRFHSIQPGWDWWWAIDNVEITGDLAFTYDNDLAAIGINGNTIVNAGNTENYEITVKNVGNNTQNNYTVRLKKQNGEELSFIDITQPIAYEEVVVHTLVWNIPADEPPGTTLIYGEVELTGDENPLNDITSYLEVEVFPQGVLQVSVGNGTILNNRIPICFGYLNSLTESLFFTEEMGGVTGLITTLTYYNNFVNTLTNEPTAIWMGETTQTNLTNGWIPATQLTQVFNGNVSYLSGQNAVIIELDTPYMYEGGNLVVMVHRPMDTQNYGTEDEFYHDETLEHIDRTRYERDNNIIFDPYNPPEVSYSFELLANITFTFFQGAMGEAEGYVYDDLGASLEGAEVLIEENQMLTYTNEQGYYHFGNILTGVYNLTASLFGYSPQTVQMEIFENQTTQVDFNLIPLGSVSVSGQVVGSDFPTIGLEDAYVTLTGFENYETYTDENGFFLFPDVYTNITYDLTIVFEGYDDYNEEVQVGSVSLELGTIIINEIACPPGNVIAIQNEPGTEVDIFWTSPGQGGGEFRYDDGIVDNEVGFTTTLANAVFGALHPNIAILQEIHWLLTSTYGTHSNVKLYLIGLDETGAPDPDQLLYESPLITNVDDEWNIYELPEQVSAPEGFLVGVGTPNVYTSIGLDDGVGEPWVFQSGTQLCTTDWTSGETWTDIGSWGPMFQKNMLIRAYGIDMGNTQNSDNVTKINKSELLVTRENISIMSQSSREFEFYNVYRFLEVLHNYPNDWDLIATGIVDTFYNDTSWILLPNEVYQFSITSVHTNGIESLPVFSQSIEKTSAGTQPEICPVNITGLGSNYPNPFNPETTISYSLKENTDVIIEVFNLKGQKVRTLVNENKNLGKHTVLWNGTDNNGESVSSGIYYYRMKTINLEETRKMILMK